MNTPQVIPPLPSRKVRKIPTPSPPHYDTSKDTSEYTEKVIHNERYYQKAAEKTLIHNAKMAQLTFFDRTPIESVFSNVDLGTSVNLGLNYGKYPHIINWNNIKQSGQMNGRVHPMLTS